MNRGHIDTHDHSEALILPVTARDEEPQSTTQESMFNYVRLSDGGIKRIAQARSEVEILADLGALISSEVIDFAKFKSHQTIREAIADIVPGMQDLKDIGIAKQEFHIRNRLMHAPVFNTASGKARFVVHTNTVNLTNERYPFTLMSVRSEGQFNSIIYEEKDSYRGIENRWSVMLNAADMQDLGLSNGDLVDIESAHGKMQAVEAKAFDLPRGNVMVYYPEANALIGRERDPRSQTPGFKSVAVAVQPSEQ